MVYSMKIRVYLEEKPLHDITIMASEKYIMKK